MHKKSISKRRARSLFSHRRSVTSAQLGSLVLPNSCATTRLGARLARQPGPNIWLLSGPIGSGKTTLVRGALRALGVRGPITSPTFALVRRYRTSGRWPLVIHVDAYRVERESEWAALDLDTSAGAGRRLLIVEWPERLHRRWPRPYLRLRFQHQRRGRRIEWRHR